MKDPSKGRALVATDKMQREDVRSRLAAIVDSSDDAILSKDLDGVISTWNAGAQRLFGYSEAEAVGQRVTFIIPPDLHDEERTVVQRLRAGERVERYKTRRVTRDRRIVDVSITVSPLRDSAGAIVAASTIMRDVTESNRVHRALRDCERRLASELARVKTLQSISTQLISEVTPESLFAQLLDAAMALMASDAASLQILSSDGQALILIGWRNFHPASAAFWGRVSVGGGSTCGVALRDHARVIVTDVESCGFMAATPDLDEYRRSEIRSVQSTPLQSRAGRPIGMISTHWRTPHAPTEDELILFDVLARQAADLIERTRAESALRESEGRFRRIANAAPVTIWMADVNKQFTYINQTWLDLTSQPREAALGTGWMKGIHPDDIAPTRETYARAFDRRERFQLEYRRRLHDGEYRSFVVTGVPIDDGDGVFAGYIGCTTDITERRQAEETLATIGQRLLDAQEEERTRIARELHDDIGQRLALLNVSLDMLLQGGDVPGTTRRRIEEARDEVISLGKDAQAYAHRLHPARLEYLGIAKAAAGLCHQIASQHDLDISFHADSAADGLSKPVSMCLYRVLQEALQNAIKHSGARRIDVTLRGGFDQIELAIADAGVGFNTETIGGFGLGLTSMTERLAALGGQLAILATPQHGTTIHARVPLVQTPHPSGTAASSSHPSVRSGATRTR